MIRNVLSFNELKKFCTGATLTVGSDCFSAESPAEGSPLASGGAPFIGECCVAVNERSERENCAAGLFAFWAKAVAVVMLCVMAMSGQGWALSSTPDTTFGGKSYYKITSCTDLKAFSTLVNKCTSSGSGKSIVHTCANSSANAILTDDITSCSGFTPIGSATKQDGSNKGSAIKDVYKGTFDGNGYTISNLSISSSNQYVGLFGYVNGGTIKSVSMTGSTIYHNSTDAGQTGAIVGHMESGTVSGCYVENTTIDGSTKGGQEWYSGGIVGYNVNGQISLCSFIGGSVTGRTTAGGIAGYSKGTVTNCLASPSVLTAATRQAGGVAGIVGDNGGSVTRSVYAGNSITTGGGATPNPVVGSNNECSSECYYTANLGYDPGNHDTQNSDIEVIKAALGDPWIVSDGGLAINTGVNYFKVIIMPNGHGEKDSITVKKNGVIGTLDSIVVDGFKRVGLCVNTECTQEWNMTTEQVTRDMTLYTKWQQAYKVTFAIGTAGLADNGHFPNNAVTSAYFVEGERISDKGITAPEFDSGELDGWNTNPESTTKLANLPVMGTSAITLYAVEKGVEFVTITYSMGSAAGASGNDVTQRVVKNKTVNLMGNLFARTDGGTGYAQTGWSTNASGTSKTYELGTSYKATANVTLYPYWTIASITVTYKFSAAKAEDGNGKTIAPMSKLSGVNINLSGDTFSKTGYEQDGWSRNENGDKNYDLNAVYANDESVILYPHWVAVYTVTFNADGGIPVPANQIVRINEKVTEPGQDPEKDGYTFNGWYADAAKTTLFNFSQTQITANTTIYAKFTPNNFTITYDKGEFGTGTILAGSKTPGLAFTLSSGKFTRSGYEQVGWATQDGSQTFELGGSYTTDADITLYPVWKQLFTVTFNANGQGEAPESQSVLDGEKATAPTAPTVTGYTFNGWNTKQDGTGSTWDFGTNTVTETTTLYAMWTINTYTVTYEYSLDGTTYQQQGDVDNVTYNAANVEVRNTYMVDGYMMSAWATEDVEVTDGKFTMPAKNVVFRATGTKKNFTITYFIGDTQAGDAVSVEFGGAITPKDTSKTGYTFSGWTWYSLADASNPVQLEESPKAMPAYNLKAVGTFAPTQYTATFDANEGVFAEGAVTSKLVDFDAAITAEGISEPTRTGYVFKGWSRTQTATAADEKLGTMNSTEGVTIYAVWVQTFTVTFNKNGHGSDVETQTVESGSNVVKPDDLSETGYTFAGWFTDDGTFENAYEFSSAVTADVTLYAKWTANSYTVTYKITGDYFATEEFETSSASFADVVNVTTKSTDKDGYTFSGWSISEGGVTILNDQFTMGSANVVLTGSYTLNSYTITYNGVDGAINPNTATSYTVESENITLQAATKAGYAFAGWYDNAEFSGDAVTQIAKGTTGNKTFYAKWTAIPVVVTIEGNSETKTYNGESQSVNGYTVKSISCDGYTCTNFTADNVALKSGVTAVASGTDASTTPYLMGLNNTSFETKNTAYTNVTFSVTDGSLTINQASDLSVTLERASFTYDGSAHALTAAATTNAKGGTTKIEYQFDGDTEWTEALASLTKVAAGTYTVNVRATNPNYSNIATNSTTLEISAATITITAADQWFTYTGSAQQVAVATTDIEGTTITYSVDGGDYGSALPSLTNADTVTVTVKAEKANYTTATKTFSFGVAKAPVTVAAENKEQVYGAEAATLTATVTGKPESGAAVNYTLARGEGANVGTYAINVTLGENPNYEITTTAGTYTITKKAVVVKATAASKTYGDADPELTSSVEGLVGDDKVEYTVSRATGENVGTYTITPSGETAQGNYSVSYEPAKFTINQLVATLSWTNTEFDFDGEDHVPTATVSNLVGTDECTVTVSGAASAAGEHTATATALSNTNYKLPANVTQKFNIKAGAFVVTLSAESATYNGTKQAPTVTVKDGEKTLALGTDYTVAWDNDGFTNAGDYKVTVTGTGNYSGSADKTYTIAKAEVSVKADDKSQVYGAAPTELTATVTGNPESGDAVNYTLARAEGDNAGEYAISVNLGENPNYEISTTSGTYTIAKAGFTVAGPNYENVYDGASHGDAAIPSVTEGTTVSYSTDNGTTWSTTAPTIKDVGEISVSVKAENANYETATTTYTLKVTKRAITLTSASDRMFYDGTALTASTVIVSEGSYANGESFQYNVTGSQIKVGASENTFTYSATSSAKVENYEVTLVKGTLTVDPVVTFVMNGHGTQVAKQEVLTGEKASEPTEPSAEGYTFGGWFTDNETFANAYDFDAVVNTNVTLYAKWTVNKYTVTFVDEDGETVLASKDYDYGTAVADIETPETPTKTEDDTYTYAFAGWSPELAAVTEAATYTATYTPTYKKYHVAFKTDANVVLSDKEDYHYGDALVVPANPTRKATDEYSYEFDKWDPAVPATVEGSKTYVAKFTPIPNKYTLTWDADGGTITSAAGTYTAAGKVAYGTELVAPVVTKEGFTFAGWTPEVSTMPAENITFKATWTEKLVVTFNVQGHGTAPANQLLDANAKAAEPTAPTAQNYNFGGWFKDAECTQAWNFDDAVTASMELFAKWTGAFSLTFTLDGVDIETRSAVSEGTVITVLDSSAKDGHDFAGWVMETEGVSFNAVTGGHKFVMPAKAVNISGAYKYLVKYILDGVQVGETETYTYGTEVTVRDPVTKTGYDVTDWASSSVTIMGGTFAMPAADVELAATSTVHKHTVTYKITGDYFANEKHHEDTDVAYGTTLTLISDNMAKEGYTFSGWSTLPETMPDDDVVLTGSYSINSYDVVWKKDDATYSSSSVAYGVEVVAPATAPTKNGYDFAGWTTSDVTLADDYSFTMPAKAVTLNADWDLVTYEIAYESNGGEAVPSSNYTIESADITLPTTTRLGYDFGGWFDNEDLSGTAVTKVAAGSFGNKKFYAKWDVVTYNITYTGLGDMTHENPATYTVEDAVVLTDPTDSTGYSFDGWYIGEDKVTGIAKGSTGAKTMVAKWSPKNVEFKVVYELYGATGSKEKTMDEVTLEGPADAPIIDNITWKDFGDGYDYELVYINDVEHNKSYFTDKIARDGSTVVKVRVEHNEFTFTFYTEGESGWKEWDEQLWLYGYDYVENNKVKAPTAPTKTGYTFVGWCADAETCESVQTFPMNVPAKNMAFYAKWTINPYTITFDTKGGSTVDAITQDYNTAVTAPENPTRAGYLFAGWDKEIPATMPAEDITITAKWNMDVKASGYTGVYDGDAHGITVTAPEGATITYSTAEDGDYVATLTYADVGTYTVYYKASQEGYADVKGSATVAITPATMTLVVAGYADTYDGAAHSGTATPSVTEGTTVSYKVGEGDWSTTAPTIKDVGEISVSVKAENANYETATNSYTLKVTKRAVTLTGETATKDFTGVEINLSSIIVGGAGLVDGHTHNATYSAKGLNAGSYAGSITAADDVKIMSGATDVTKNYAITTQAGSLTILSAGTFTIALDTASFIYDGTAHHNAKTATSTAASGTTTFQYSLDSTAWVSDLASLTETNAGTYTIYVVGTNTNYPAAAVAKSSLAIAKASVTITVAAAEKTYGDADPEFTGKVEGLVAASDLGEIKYVRVGAGQNVGTYSDSLTATYVPNDNYDVNVVPATFTITPKAITVAVAGATSSVVYDGAEHAVSGFTATTSDELYNVNSVVLAEGKTASATTTNVGKVFMNLTYASFVNNDANFTVTFNVTDGYSEVTPKAAVVKAVAASKIYGDTDPTFTATVVGTIGEDKVEYSLVRAEGENVGEYSITASGDAEQGNYSVTFANGSFTISKKSVTITVAAASKTYGEADPVFTGKVEGLVNEDDLGVIMYIRTNTTTVENAGTYPNVLTVNFTDNENYSVTVVKADFTVNKRSVTFTGESMTKGYTGEEFELTAFAIGGDGLVEGHSHNVTYSVKGAEVGKYTGSITDVADVKIMAGETDVTANYAITTEAGKLTIQAAGVFSIALKNDTYTFDGLAHYNAKTATSTAKSGTTTFQYQFNGDGDIWVSDLASLTKTDVGTYTINVKAVNANYGDIATTTAKLTILPKTATVSAVAAGKITGSKDPELFATVTGLVGEDKVEYVVTRTEGETVGNYLVTPVGAEVQGNYKVVYETARFVISPAVKVVLAEGMELLCTESTCDADGYIKHIFGSETTMPLAKVSGDEAWKFQGWFENTNGLGTPIAKISSDIAKDMILYPYFTKTINAKVDSSEVTVVVDMDDTQDSLDRKVTFEARITLPVPNKSSDNLYTYRFTKYAYNAKTDIYESQFTPVPRTFRILFNLPEGAVLSTEIETYTYGETTKLPTASIKGAEDWEFKGWYTKPDGNGTRVKVISAGEFGEKTLYPLFQKTIAYDANGARGEVSAIYAENAEMVINAALTDVVPQDYEKKGETYTFDKWILENGTYVAKFTQTDALKAASVPHFTVSVMNRVLEISGARMGAKVAVFDMRGTLVASGIVENGTQRVEIAQPGSYIVRVNNQVRRVNIR